MKTWNKILKQVNKYIPFLFLSTFLVSFEKVSIFINIFLRLQEVCEAEGVDVGNGEILQDAVDTCEGDLRRALTALQCCQRLIGKITPEGLIEVRQKKKETKGHNFFLSLLIFLFLLPHNSSLYHAVYRK